MNIQILLLLLITCSTGCSFKKPEGKKSLAPQVSTLNSIEIDSDGDGITDLEENSKGTNPLVANIPEFEGQFFDEMKLTVNFLRRNDNKAFSTSFQVSSDIVAENGSPIEERDFISKGREFIPEEAARQAAKVSFYGSHLKSSFDRNFIGLYSPPRINEKRVIPFSKNVSEILKFADYHTGTFWVTNNLKISFRENYHYTDLVMDLFYFDDVSKKLVLLGTDFLKGTYQFNKSYPSVPLTFQVAESKKVANIVESGVRNVFIRIRDFKIVQTGKFYRQLLHQVEMKSVPLIFSTNSATKTIYVGTNGRAESLSYVLRNGLGGIHTQSNNKIVSVGDLSERTEIIRGARGESEQIEYKWFLMTNEINNNPFSYSFLTEDIISLSYNKSIEDFNLVPSYLSIGVGNNNVFEPKTIFTLKQNLKKLKINVRPSVYEGSSQNVAYNEQCPDQKQNCFSYSYSSIKSNGIQAKDSIAAFELVINGKTFNLLELYQKGILDLRIKNSEILEFSFTETLFQYINSSNALTILIKKKDVFEQVFCTGYKLCESSDFECESLISSPPSCTEEGQNDRYRILSFTNSIKQSFKSEVFISVEYI